MVCRKLRTFYFENIPWIDCYKDVAVKFAILKKNSINFYKNEIEMLIALEKFTFEEFEEAINF